MKVILQLDALLDDLYADSALADLSEEAPVLTSDRRAALQRLLINAVADLIGELSPALCDIVFPDSEDPGCCIIFEFSDDITLSPEILGACLSSVIVRSTLRHLAIARGDTSRSTLHAAALTASLNHLRSLLLTPSLPPPLVPSYL